LIAAVVSVFVGFVLAGFATPASADIGDVVNSMQIDYTVSSDGMVHVKETINYHFGTSGRHGIYRNLVTREKYKDDTSKDQKYEVSNIKVSSQTPGVSSDFTEDTTRSEGQRDESLQIKIGSADRTISGTDATYVIQYDVRGALRHFADHSELYWDATGSEWDATLRNVTVNVLVPGGVQRVECFTGTPGSTTSCEQKVSGQKGVFYQSDIPRGNQ
jgi:hypothetical protein